MTDEQTNKTKQKCENEWENKYLKNPNITDE